MPEEGVIDSLHFARAASEQRGVLGMEKLQRLAKMQCSTEGLEYCLRGGRTGNGKPCLRISVRGLVELLCQRCLAPFPVPIAIDAELQLSESLREISEADDERSAFASSHQPERLLSRQEGRQEQERVELRWRE